jgi:hypothetical protein
MRPARAIASTAPGIAPRSTSAVTVVVMRSSRSDESPICSGRSARGKPSIVPWLVMAFSSAIPRLSAKRLQPAIADTPLACFDRDLYVAQMPALTAPQDLEHVATWQTFTP